jgi:CubicO group peptidase (beta-lactamase class C family)
MADTEFREKSVPVPASLRAAVALLQGVRLASAPGAAFHYHNPNYWVAARLVEVVSGEPFASYLERHVLVPTGMTTSSTVADLRRETVELSLAAAAKLIGQRFETDADRALVMEYLGTLGQQN